MITTRSSNVLILMGVVFLIGRIVTSTDAFVTISTTTKLQSSSSSSVGGGVVHYGTASDNSNIDDMAFEKATKAMTAFTNKYLELSCTKLCADKSIPAVVIKGLAEHKVQLGSPLCPCRFYDDKIAEAKDGYWNCPCVPMRERQECHCMLFLTEENQFAGTESVIQYDEVITLTQEID